jgi:hypothetical protein
MLITAVSIGLCWIAVSLCAANATASLLALPPRCGLPGRPLLLLEMFLLLLLLLLLLPDVLCWSAPSEPVLGDLPLVFRLLLLLLLLSSSALLAVLLTAHTALLYKRCVEGAMRRLPLLTCLEPTDLGPT